MKAKHPVLTFALKTVYIGSLVGAGLGAWLVRLDPAQYQNYPTSIGAIADYVRAHTWAIVLLPGLAGLSKYGLERLERRWVGRMIHALLTEYRRNLFGSLGGAKEEHRATLFVHRGFALWRTLPWSISRHPWSGWLVPVSRSDHTSQRVRARFLAPDRSRKSEGIAGQTWREAAIVTVDKLPELTKLSTASDISDYCRRTHVSESWVRSRLDEGESLPRSLRGLPIEVDNVVWGVVVLDSSREQAFTHDALGTEKFTLIFSSTMGRLLERALT